VWNGYIAKPCQESWVLYSVDGMLPLTVSANNRLAGQLFYDALLSALITAMFYVVANENYLGVCASASHRYTHAHVQHTHSHTNAYLHLLLTCTRTRTQTHLHTNTPTGRAPGFPQCAHLDMGASPHHPQVIHFIFVCRLNFVCRLQVIYFKFVSKFSKYSKMPVASLCLCYFL